MATKLEKLAEAALKAKEKAEQAKKRLALAEAGAKKKASEEERRKDTKRKILIGAWTQSTKSAEQIASEINGYLTRNEDRALFNLPPLPSPSGGDSPKGTTEQQQQAAD